MQMFAKRPCLGWMPLRDGRLSDLVWITYEQVNTKSLQFGSGLLSLVERVSPLRHEISTETKLK